MKRTIIVVLFLIWGQAGARVRAAEGDAGQLGSTIRIGQGARALAMGSAYSSIADDDGAAFFNPAGITQLDRPSLGFAWRVMPLLDRKQGYASFTVPLRDKAALGLSWIHSGVGDILERNSRGAAGDNYSFHENFVTLSFAKLFGQMVSVGGSMHVIQQSFFNVSANSIGLSAGALVEFDRRQRRPFSDVLQRLSLAAVVQHVGLTLRYDSRDYYGTRGGYSGTTSSNQFPVVVRGGAAYRFLRNRSLLISADVSWVEDQHVRGYFGAEWALLGRLMLRGGLADSDPTLGLGLRQGWGKIQIGFDYAFLTSPVAEDADHVISLSLVF